MAETKRTFWRVTRGGKIECRPHRLKEDWDGRFPGAPAGGYRPTLETLRANGFGDTPEEAWAMRIAEADAALQKHEAELADIPRRVKRIKAWVETSRRESEKLRALAQADAEKAQVLTLTA